MALLMIEGFDHYGTGTLVGNKWSAIASVTLVNTSPRTGLACASLAAGANDMITKVITTSTGFVIGFAFKMTVIASNNLCQVREGTTNHLVLETTATGKMQVLRGASVLLVGSTTIVANNWYYVEFKGIIHDTTGSYELRIDGVTELTQTGIDTRNVGTTGQWDRVRFNGTSGTSTFIDDFYMCDQSGSAPRNTFLGPVKIETLLPQTDAVAAGSNAGLTPSTGTDHGALVDENPANTTDYNGSATVGVKDTYQYPSMALTGTILGIQTNLYCVKSDATARTVCAVVRTNIDYDGTAFSPTTSFLYQSEIQPVNPNGSTEWTTSDISTIQVGMKVVS